MIVWQKGLEEFIPACYHSECDRTIQFIGERREYSVFRAKVSATSGFLPGLLILFLLGAD